MTPQPTATPPPNGHAPVRGAAAEQPIRDRWGRLYLLRGDFGPADLRFRVATPLGNTVGRVGLEIADRIGHLVELHVADEGAPWLPPGLRRPLVRLFPHWSATGHRGRGIGSLLLIYALKAACDRELRRVVVTDPIPAAAIGMFRNLGFELPAPDASSTASYRISD